MIVAVVDTGVDAQQPDLGSLDVGRPNAADHIGFGSGIHVCIGAPLARIELEPERIPAFVVRGYRAVNVTITR